jgi:hypothetical protein
MNRRRLPRALGASCLLAIAASCTETIRPAPRVVPIAAPPVAQANGVAFYLTLSNDSPRPGDRVLVTARTLHGVSAKGVGSFNLAVQYDAAALSVVDTPIAGDGMVVFNPLAGELRAAGASTTGFATGELFHFVVAVGNPEGLRSLRLDVKDAVSTGFADHRSTMVVARDFVRDAVNQLLPKP